jgi:hypothetical protein
MTRIPGLIFLLGTLDFRLRCSSRFQLFSRRPHLVVWRGALSVHALASNSLNTFDIEFTSPEQLMVSDCNTNRKFRKREYTYILNPGSEDLGLRMRVCVQGKCGEGEGGCSVVRYYVPAA